MYNRKTIFVALYGGLTTLSLTTLTHQSNILTLVEGTSFAGIAHVRSREFLSHFFKGTTYKSVCIHDKDMPHHNSRHIEISKGIVPQNKPYVTIFIRGYAPVIATESSLPRNGGGFLGALVRYKNNIIYDYCITADPPNDLADINFGQALDQKFIASLVNPVVETNPSCKIMLMGECLGTIGVLAYAANAGKDVEAIDAIALESAFVSLEDLTKGLQKNYYSWLGSFAGSYINQAIAYFFSKASSYKAEYDTFWDSCAKISGKHIFIAHRVHDTIIHSDPIEKLAKVLAQNNTVYFYNHLAPDQEHGGLYVEPTYQQAFNYFLKCTGRKHNDVLAEQGEQLLNTQQPTEAEKEAIIASFNLVTPTPVNE